MIGKIFAQFFLKVAKTVAKPNNDNFKTAYLGENVIDF